ncbi:MAG: IS3 family transposase [Flavobacteriales bacterium]|nr:IS3 family transposase [Flavobacteriales bacterium]
MKKGGRHLLQERSVRYEFIKNHKKEFPIEKMCLVLKVSRSGYYKWLSAVPSKRKLYQDFLKAEIKQVYQRSKCRYGSPRITKELNMKEIKASQPLVAKLMREEKICSIIRKKYRVTTNSSHHFAVVENKLNRNFEVEAKNKVWVSDITYISTKEGWMYLTTVIDLFDRKVIGWALSETMKAKDTTISAFKMATINRPLVENKELIFHSDRGVQYACDEFKMTLKQQKIVTQSMCRKGNCWDNAVAESFFKTLKTELIYHHRYQTKRQAALSVFEYIETWYNKNRRHNHLNNLTILEHENLINNNLKNAA